MQNATQVAYQESLNKAIGFIEKNLDRKILLKDIAQEALFIRVSFSNPLFRVFSHLFIDLDKTMELYLTDLKAQLGE